MREEQARWEVHDHSQTVHSHEHYHVTHNYNERVGGFDHLSSQHEHEHDHAQVSHDHFPHQDFEYEHRFEAHDHDHGEPVKERSPVRKKTTAAPRKSATRKTGQAG